MLKDTQEWRWQSFRLEWIRNKESEKHNEKRGERKNEKIY